MINKLKKLIFILIIIKFKSNKNLLFTNLNFRKIDFTNYKQIKTFIFKKTFIKLKTNIFIVLIF